jgi:hypothetical protein
MSNLIFKKHVQKHKNILCYMLLIVVVIDIRIELAIRSRKIYIQLAIRSRKISYPQIKRGDKDRG